MCHHVKLNLFKAYCADMMATNRHRWFWLFLGLPIEFYGQRGHNSCLLVIELGNLPYCFRLNKRHINLPRLSLEEKGRLLFCSLYGLIYHYMTEGRGAECTMWDSILSPCHLLFTSGCLFFFFKSVCHVGPGVTSSVCTSNVSPARAEVEGWEFSIFSAETHL